MSQNKIYVGNLSYDATATDIEDHFKAYGAITDVKLISDRDTGRSKGFSFVTFETDADANNAVQNANGSEMMGRNLRVNLARDDRGGRGGQRPQRNGNFNRNRQPEGMGDNRDW